MPVKEKPASKFKNILKIIHTLALIAVPVVIAVVGAEYNASIKDSENRIRYVELAIAQLRSTPTPETAALREWAVELLDSQSPIKLSSMAKAQLKASALPLVLSATASGAALTSGTATITAGKASGTNSGSSLLQDKELRTKQ